MTQRIIKRLLCLVCLCGCCLGVVSAQGDMNKRAYVLFDNTGKEITYGELVKQLSGYDIVFLGEIHNCPITHWLEFEIARSMYAIHKDKLMLGAEMLESDKRVDIALKPDTTEEVICKEEIMENDVRVVKSMPNLADFSTRTGGLANEDKIRVEPDGRVISIVTEMEGRHWEQDVRGGRDVVLKNVMAYENGGKHFLYAEVNGERTEHPLTEEQFKELRYRTDEVRIEIVDKILDKISFKNGDYKGEVVNALGTDASRLSEIKDSKGWFREGKNGREVSVGHIGVQTLDNGKYVMKGLIDGEMISRDISKKEYDKFLAMDDYHRMRMFSKLFEEVDMKERLGVGARITAALAAGVTVMGELALGGEPDMRHYRPHGVENSVRAYYKPGVDTPEEIAMRNFEAAANTANIQNGLRK